ncbi:hypothetical protein V1499_23105 (plasmid) [Neobacillus sp. SCS-31]|uniref:hypothetical protein n=1 Tax=Neobacillus oceani TaxID=3115292 RepID=UPI003906963F
MKADLISVNINYIGEHASYIDAAVHYAYYLVLSEEEQREVIKVLEELVESYKEFGFPFYSPRLNINTVE